MGMLPGLIIGGLSGSRKAMLGLMIIGLMAPFLALAGGGRQVLMKYAKAMVMGMIGLAVIGLMVMQLPQFERLTRLREGVGADRSAETRLDMAKETIDIWLDYPIEGAGFQGFGRVSTNFPGRYSHTTYGEVLANGGLIGISLILIFYLLPGFQMILIVQRTKQAPVRQLATGLLLFWALFCMSSLFAVLYDSKDLLPMWAAICGWIHQHRSTRMAMPQLKRSFNPRSHHVVRAPAA
jgi:O-antigen ligase